MSNVVAFKPGKTKRKPQAFGPCQLLFFTGVRYVRHAEAPKPARRKPKVRRRRA